LILSTDEWILSLTIEAETYSNTEIERNEAKVKSTSREVAGEVVVALHNKMILHL